MRCQFTPVFAIVVANNLVIKPHQTSGKKIVMTGSDNSINRREMLKQGIAAGFGVAAPYLLSLSGEKMTVTGLPSEYDKYDALGLAGLVEEKQMAPADVHHTDRQRVAALQSTVSAFCPRLVHHDGEQL